MAAPLRSLLPDRASGASDSTPGERSVRDRALVATLQHAGIFRDYRQAFETATGLPLAIRAAGSFALPMHGSNNINPFCALMATGSKTCAACLQLQQRVEEGANSEPTTLECFAGLSDSAVPIRVGESIVGHLQTGQVLLCPPSDAQFRRAARQVRQWGSVFNPRKLKAAYFRTRVIDPKHYEAALRLLAVFAQHLSALSNQLVVKQASPESPAIAKARRYIAEHHEEELSLGEVARAASMSGFYFCKVFKRATGLTFTDYLARSRAEKVKELLLDPHTRVSEAAYAAGFQSLSQFNRVFRRVARESPTAFRDRLHRPGGDARLTRAA